MGKTKIAELATTLERMRHEAEETRLDLERLSCATWKHPASEMVESTAEKGAQAAEILADALGIPRDLVGTLSAQVA